MKTVCQAIEEGYRVAKIGSTWGWFNIYFTSEGYGFKGDFPTELEAIASLREHLDKALTEDLAGTGR